MEKTVVVTQYIKVKIDENKFDEDFMEEFRESFFDFTSLDDHIKHLAQLYARGIADSGSFIEGYGPAEDMGISFSPEDQEEEIEVDD